MTFLTYNIFFMSSRTISVGIREKKKDDGNDQRSRERARTEVSECLRWRKFRDGRRSDAKLISRLNSGFFIPPPLLAPE